MLGSLNFIYLEMVFELSQNTIPEQPCKQGAQGVSEPVAAITAFVKILLILG